MSDVDHELQERRQAELEVIQAAYEAHEVSLIAPNVIQRHLDGFLIDCELSNSYPDTPLNVRIKLDRSASKAHHNARVALLDICREASELNAGQESILMVLQAADDWYQASFMDKAQHSTTLDELSGELSYAHLKIYFIYSHHIIGKQKRADMKHLFNELNLTGFIKIGWPGLMVVEGEPSCVLEYYTTIRRWAWQYLNLREEHTTWAGSLRNFGRFQETDDMSVAAQLCRDAGMESHFRKSLKLQNS